MSFISRIGWPLLILVSGGLGIFVFGQVWQTIPSSENLFVRSLFDLTGERSWHVLLGLQIALHISCGALMLLLLKPLLKGVPGPIATLTLMIVYSLFLLHPAFAEVVLFPPFFRLSLSAFLFLVYLYSAAHNASRLIRSVLYALFLLSSVWAPIQALCIYAAFWLRHRIHPFRALPNRPGAFPPSKILPPLGIGVTAIAALGVGLYVATPFPWSNDLPGTLQLASLRWFQTIFPYNPAPFLQPIPLGWSALLKDFSVISAAALLLFFALFRHYWFWIAPFALGSFLLLLLHHTAFLFDPELRLMMGTGFAYLIFFVFVLGLVDRVATLTRASARFFFLGALVLLLVSYLGLARAPLWPDIETPLRQSLDYDPSQDLLREVLAKELYDRREDSAFLKETAVILQRQKQHLPFALMRAEILLKEGQVVQARQLLRRFQITDVVASAKQGKLPQGLARKHYYYLLLSNHLTRQSNRELPRLSFQPNKSIPAQCMEQLEFERFSPRFRRQIPSFCRRPFHGSPKSE